MMTMFWSQFLYQIPVVGASVIGMILALAFWRRCPGACLFALLGFGVLFVLGFSQSLANAYLITARMERGWSAEQYGHIMTAANSVIALVRTVGFAFVLLAVFSDRPAGPANEPPRL
jgi:hypothetical protein